MKPIAEQPSRSASLTLAGDRLVGVFLGARQAVGVVELEDQRDLPGKGAGAGLDKAERRGIGDEPGLDRQLEVVMRVVGRRVRREAARRAVLEALVDRQDHQLAGAAELAVHQDAGEVRLGAGIVAFVIGEDLLDLAVDLHRSFLRAAFGSAVSFSKSPPGPRRSRGIGCTVNQHAGSRPGGRHSRTWRNDGGGQRKASQPCAHPRRSAPI